MPYAAIQFLANLRAPGRVSTAMCLAWLAGMGLVLWLLLRRRPSRCARCGEVNRSPAVFCAQCGQRLPGR